MNVKKENYIHHLNKSLNIFFKDALKISLRSPAQAYYFLRTVQWQSRAARIRSHWARQGIHVPPIIIFSITSRCNLHCKGCYAQALNRSTDEDMSSDQLKRIIKEAYELGTSFFVFAGGEPLIRREIIEITARFPEIIFLIFTNGLLIDEALLKKFKKQKNVVPVISLEGQETETDDRRGEGIHYRLQNIVTRIHREGIFFSISVTITSANLSVVTNGEFVKDMIDAGCKLFFFLEYTPIREGTELWVPAEEEREKLNRAVQSFRKKYSALFISVPDDEKQFGGCLSSGRGFVHINAAGDLEPCPFTPFSDTNLKEKSLKDALRSDLLRVIRQNSDRLEEGRGGCSLWQKRDWVRSLLAEPNEKR